MTTEDLWFRIIIIVVLILLLVLAIINAVYWNKIRNSGCGVQITSGQATLYFWLNLIAIFIIAIMLIWAMVRIFVKPKPDAAKAARELMTTPPLEIHPVQQAQYQHQIVTNQPIMTQPVVTSTGYTGNVVSGAGVQQLEREAMYV